MLVTPDTPSPASDQVHKPLIPSGSMLVFIFVTTLFFLWGMANNLNDILIRQFTKSFDLSHQQWKAGLVQFATMIGYFIFGMPSGLIIRRLGYKAGMVTGLLLFSAGTFLFWPAAHINRYGFFLFALFVIGSGLSFLETASSPFIVQMGAPERSEQRLNLAASFNPLGSILGILAGTVFIFSGVELSESQVAHLKDINQYGSYMHQETLRVVPTYMVFGCFVLLFAVAMSRLKFPVIHSEDEDEQHKARFLDLFQYRHFVLAVVAQFLYVGAQISTWSYFIRYAQHYVNIPEKTAGLYLTGSLVALAAGRFFSTWLMKFIAPNKLTGIYAIINALLLAVGVLFPGWLGLWTILMTSFFMSIMFPSIFALGLKGLGPNTKMGGSLLVTSIIGGAVLTLGMGFVMDKSSIALAYMVPLVAYFFIAFYGFVGSHERQRPS